MSNLTDKAKQAYERYAQSEVDKCKSSQNANACASFVPELVAEIEKHESRFEKDKRTISAQKARIEQLTEWRGHAQPHRGD